MTRQKKHEYIDCFQKERLERIEEEVGEVRTEVNHVIKSQTENTIAINKLTVTIEEKEKQEAKREKEKIRREEKREKEKTKRLQKRMQYIGIIGGIITGVILLFAELAIRRII